MHFRLSKSHFLSTKPRSKLQTNSPDVLFQHTEQCWKMLKVIQKNCTISILNLTIQAPHCLLLMLRTSSNTSCVSTESQNQQAFTEHLSHAKIFFFTWSIKSIIWDRNDYSHFTQEKTEVQKIKLWRLSQNDIDKTSWGHSPKLCPNFKARTLFIRKEHRFLTLELLLLCYCTVPG